MPKNLAIVKPGSAADPFAGLSPEARAWCADVAAEFDLDGHHERLLIGAATSWDRAQQARAVLDEHGLTFLDRFRQIKERPEVAIERNALNSFRLLVRELGLDLPAVGDNRPPRL